MKQGVAFTSLIILSLVQDVLAHPGPRIWIDVVNGKVTTYAGPYPPSDPGNYFAEYIFSQALSDEGDDVWTTEFPGFQKVPGGNIPVGKNFSYNIVGPLQWYDAGAADHCPFFESVFDSFADAPPIPQMAITNELFQTQYTDEGFVPGNLAFTYNGAAGDHNHLTYTLLGDGQGPGGGENGVFALALQITATGITASNTIFLLLGKNASAGELGLAMDVMRHPRVAPDMDCDSDVDSSDYDSFESCMSGPDQFLASELGQCRRADANADERLDLRDFAALQRCFSGSGVPTLQICGYQP